MGLTRYATLFLLVAVTFSAKESSSVKLAELQEKIEIQEAQLLQQSKLADSLAEAEKRIDKLQQLQTSRIKPIELRLEAAERKLKEFTKLPDLVSQLESRLEKLMQDNITSLEFTKRQEDAELGIKIDLFTVQAQKISAMESKLQKIESRQTKLSNLPDLHTSGQVAVNKLHDAADVISIQEKMKKAEQKLLEYSSLPELFRQLESRMNAKQTNAIDRISLLESQFVGMKKIEGELQQKEARFKAQAEQLSGLQSKLEIVEGAIAHKNIKNLPEDPQLQRDVESLVQSHRDYETQFKAIASDVSAFRTILNSVHEDLMPNQTTPEKNMTMQLNNVVKRVSSVIDNVQKDVSSLKQIDTNLEKELLSLKKERFAERISTLEGKIDVRMVNEAESLSDVINFLLVDMAIYGGNITELRANSASVQKEITSMKAQLQSQVNDIWTNANKLIAVEATLVRHGTHINATKLAQADEARTKRERADLEDAIRKVHEDLQQKGTYFYASIKRLEQGLQHKVAALYAAMEKMKEGWQQKETTLYESVRVVEQGLQRKEALIKSQNDRISSAMVECTNASTGLGELKAQVNFFHPDFDINGIVNPDKRRTRLHLAAMDGDANSVRYLLGKGANIEAQDYKKWRPLHLASWQGNLEVVKLLLRYGAKIDAIDEFRYTPLHWASQYGSETCVSLLLDQGANIEAKDINDERPLHKAAWYEQGKIIEILLKRGAQIDAYRRDGYTALHLAAQKGYLDCVRILVKMGANLDSRTVDGFTPAGLAIANDKKAVVSYFRGT